MAFHACQSSMIDHLYTLRTQQPGSIALLDWDPTRQRNGTPSSIIERGFGMLFQAQTKGRYEEFHDMGGDLRCSLAFRHVWAL
jgi:hypothetical protein